MHDDRSSTAEHARFLQARRRRAFPPSLPPLARAQGDPRVVFERFLKEQAQISKYMDIKEMVSRWHWGHPKDQLTRGNVADL